MNSLDSSTCLLQFDKMTNSGPNFSFSANRVTTSGKYDWKMTNLEIEAIIQTITQSNNYTL